MKTDCKAMMKDGIALKEIGERMIEYARMMEKDQEKKDDKKGAGANEKGAIAMLLKKRMEYD